MRIQPSMGLADISMVLQVQYSLEKWHAAGGFVLLSEALLENTALFLRQLLVYNWTFAGSVIPFLKRNRFTKNRQEYVAVV